MAKTAIKKDIHKVLYLEHDLEHWFTDIYSKVTETENTDYNTGRELKMNKFFYISALLYRKSFGIMPPVHVRDIIEFFLEIEEDEKRQIILIFRS